MLLKKRRYSLKITRKIHRITAGYLFILFIVLAISGLTLGWKKNSNGLILPKTQVGSSTDLTEWKTLDQLQIIAFSELKKYKPEITDFKLNRIDARPDKGIVKFIFKDHFWEVQLDGKTGEMLSLRFRNSDLMEEFHDGSILDRIFGTEQEVLKLIYVSTMGIALLLFTITGIWLWFVPKIRKP